MTSLAFILGVVPLVLGKGPGPKCGARWAPAVFGGMLGVTLFGIFLTPVFYYVIVAYQPNNPSVQDFFGGEEKSPIGSLRAYTAHGFHAAMIQRLPIFHDDNDLATDWPPGIGDSAKWRPCGTEQVGGPGAVIPDQRGGHITLKEMTGTDVRI